MIGLESPTRIDKNEHISIQREALGFFCAIATDGSTAYCEQCGVPTSAHMQKKGPAAQHQAVQKSRTRAGTNDKQLILEFHGARRRRTGAPHSTGDLRAHDEVHRQQPITPCNSQQRSKTTTSEKTAKRRRRSRPSGLGLPDGARSNAFKLGCFAQNDEHLK